MDLKLKIKHRSLQYIVAFLSLCVFSLHAQKSKRYFFIEYSLNRLYFSSDSTSYKSLFKKMSNLKSTGQTQINMVHIGGSHIQAGIWSHNFINELQHNFNSKGGGYFIFPYKVAKTNGQPYASSFTNGVWKRCRAIGKDSCQDLGMNAIRVTTNDSANYFGVVLNSKSSIKGANVIRMYHNFNSSFLVQLSVVNSKIINKVDQPWQGYTEYTLSSPVDSLAFLLNRIDTLQKDFSLYGFSVENTLSGGFYLAALGANGASSTSFLKCNYFIPQLRSIKPDLVILSLGVNDTQSKGFEKEEYIEHYDSLIYKIKEAYPEAAILLTTTTDNFVKRRTSNKRTVKAQEAMFELMKKHHVAVWDLFALMGGYKSMTKWQKAGLAARDKVHFNAVGYTLVGKLMYEALMSSYQNYLNSSPN